MRALLLAILLGLVPTAVAAQVEGTIFAGGRFGGSISDPLTNRSQTLDGALSYGLIVDFPVRGPGRFIEVVWSRQTSDVEAMTSFDDFELTIDLVQIGGLYRWEGRSVEPFVLMTLGATIFSGDGGLGTDAAASGSLGVGFRWAPSDRVAFRFEGRGWATFELGSAGLFCSGGCILRLSGGGMWQTELLGGLTITF